MSEPAAVAAAMDLVGCPFRLRGRDPETGIDCVGVIAEVLTRTGGTAHTPGEYALRNTSIQVLLASAEASGLVPTQDAAEAGTVVLFDLGADQFHLAIAVGNGNFVHAHAGLRKVVHGKADPSWKSAAIWRFPTPLKD